MSQLATPVRKRSVSLYDAEIEGFCLIPTPLEVNKPEVEKSVTLPTSVTSQFLKDIEGLRQFHFENLRLHREIDDAIGCYANLARRGSKISSSLPCIVDQTFQSAFCATSATLRRKRAVSSLRDLESTSPLDQLITEIERHLEPVSPEDGDKDLMDCASQEGIFSIGSSGSSCRSSFEERRPKPSTHPVFDVGSLTEYQITYPEQERRFSEPVSPMTLATGATTATHCSV